MDKQHNPLEHNIKIPYNGWRIPIRELYYAGGFVALLLSVLGAWYDVTRNQSLALYRLNEMQRIQMERSVVIEKLAERVHSGEIERGKISTQLQAISEYFLDQKKDGGG